MTPEDARKLVGGYATGTLTGEERTQLFAAALRDQDLFDQLEREEALKELLADPVSKAAVVQALTRSYGWDWRWWAAGALATAAVIMVLVVSPRHQPEPLNQVAQARKQPEAPSLGTPSEPAPPIKAHRKSAHLKPAAPPPVSEPKPAATAALSQDAAAPALSVKQLDNARMEVRSSAAGRLTVSERDSNGVWQSVFETSVAEPNQPVIIPVVIDHERTVRVAIGTPAREAQTFARNAAAPAAPASVEITLRPLEVP